MSAYERLGRLLREPLPGVAGGDRERDMMAAAGCELQAQVAGALCLYIQGDVAGVNELLGRPDTLPAAAVAAPLLASFDAAAEAINAAVGDDRTRGYAALATLQERAAEFAQARDLLIARHAGANVPPNSRPAK